MFHVYLSKCKFLILDHEYHAEIYCCYITYSVDAMRERANKCLSAAECKLNALATQQSMCCGTKGKNPMF